MSSLSSSSTIDCIRPKQLNLKHETIYPKKCKKVPSENSPTSGCIYDSKLQLWIERETGIALVLSNFANTSARFGETLLTETRESADQRQITSLIPNFPSNSMSIESKRSTNELVFHFIQQFVVNAPYSHF